MVKIASSWLQLKSLKYFNCHVCPKTATHTRHRIGARLLVTHLARLLLPFWFEPTTSVFLTWFTFPIPISCGAGSWHLKCFWVHHPSIHFVHPTVPFLSMWYLRNNFMELLGQLSRSLWPLKFFVITQVYANFDNILCRLICRNIHPSIVVHHDIRYYLDY